MVNVIINGRAVKVPEKTTILPNPYSLLSEGSQ